MKLKLLLLSVFTLSNVFSQNTNTFSNPNFTELKDSYTNISTKGGSLKESSGTAKPNLLEKHRLWINMTNTGGAFKQLLIGYIEGATNGLDSDFDGVSLDANPYIDFYSINSGTNLVIQGRSLPFSASDEVQLGYRTIIEGDFTIAIDHADGLLTNQAVFLEDKQTNIIHDLSSNDYVFATTAGTFKNRFILRYKSQSLGDYDFEKENKVTVWSNNESINISSASENIDKIFVYNISGQLIYTDDSVLNNQISINDIKSTNEVLLIKIILRNNHIENKKIIY